MKISKATVLLCIALTVSILFGLSLLKKDKPADSKNIVTSTSATTEKSTEKPTEKTTKKNKKREINPDDKLIALTFDDGPYSPVTEKILDTLEANDSVATFFIVGNRLEGNQQYQNSLKRAFDLGCEIGSHTYTHTYLTKMSAQKKAEELNKTNDIVKKITGKGIDILRPPGGFSISDVDYPLIMWSVDSKDWKYREANADYKEVMNNVFDGCIVLMHDLYPASAEAAAKFIPELISQGYKFVTVSELAEARGIVLENGQSFSSARPQLPEESELQEHTTVLDNTVE